MKEKINTVFAYAEHVDCERLIKTKLLDYSELDKASYDK